MDEPIAPKADPLKRENRPRCSTCCLNFRQITNDTILVSYLLSLALCLLPFALILSDHFLAYLYTCILVYLHYNIGHSRRKFHFFPLFKTIITPIHPIKSLSCVTLREEGLAIENRTSSIVNSFAAGGWMM
jgi:hypothetical protein